MLKLLYGVARFRETLTDDFRERFRQLALGQKPDALLIACSDSRVVPNLFASADPGDLFVIRNIGNLIPPPQAQGHSETAALDFAIRDLAVRDVIICGHSECGAMQAQLQDSAKNEALTNWLAHAAPRGSDGSSTLRFSVQLSELNRLSQANVLLQMQHLQSHDWIAKKISTGELRLHAWWFDIARADLYYYHAAEHAFRLLDQAEVEKLIKQLCA